MNMFYIADIPIFFLFLRCRKCVHTMMKMSWRMRRAATPATRHVTFRQTSTSLGSNISSEAAKDALFSAW